MNTPKAVTVEPTLSELVAWLSFATSSYTKGIDIANPAAYKFLNGARITLQKLQAARDALKGGAMCLEATALSHRHPSMSKGATKTDLNDAMRAGDKASDDKLLHAAALRALGAI